MSKKSINLRLDLLDKNRLEIFHQLKAFEKLRDFFETEVKKYSEKIIGLT